MTLALTLPGLFVYPMDEYTTVVGFEAVIADRVVTIQIKDKAKLDRSHLDIQSATVTGKKSPRSVVRLTWMEAARARASGTWQSSMGLSLFSYSKCNEDPKRAGSRSFRHRDRVV